MFKWFVQGMEKVIPQPLARVKQDAQVRGYGGDDKETKLMIGGQWGSPMMMR